MEIVTPQSADLGAIFEAEEEVRPLGPIPSGIAERLRELEQLAGPSSRVILARDWEGCAFALLEGFPMLDVLAFSDDGRIGYGGVNVPRLFPTLGAMLAQEGSR